MTTINSMQVKRFVLALTIPWVFVFYFLLSYRVLNPKTLPDLSMRFVIYGFLVLEGIRMSIFIEKQFRSQSKEIQGWWTVVGYLLFNIFFDLLIPTVAVFCAKGLELLIVYLNHKLPT